MAVQQVLYMIRKRVEVEEEEEVAILALRSGKKHFQLEYQ